MATKKKPVTEEVTEAPAKEAKPAKKAPKAKKAPEPEPKKEAKPAKKAKKEEKPAEPVKPAVTEAHAYARGVRVTPRKVRLVIDLVRGKDVDEALAILAHLNRAASVPVSKVIKSAAANATNNFGLDGSKLYVESIQAGDGIRMKRYIPRAKGSSSSIVKRTSNIRVTVKERK